MCAQEYVYTTACVLDSMCVCQHVYTCVCACQWRHACVCMSVRMPVRVTRACEGLCAQQHVCMTVCMRVSMCIHACVHAYGGMHVLSCLRACRMHACVRATHAMRAVHACVRTHVCTAACVHDSCVHDSMWLACICMRMCIHARVHVYGGMPVGVCLCACLRACNTTQCVRATRACDSRRAQQRVCPTACVHDSMYACQHLYACLCACLCACACVYMPVCMPIAMTACLCSHACAHACVHA